MSLPTTQRPRQLHLALAFGSGGLLTLAVFVNAEAGRYGGAMFSSWLAHGTGSFAAIVFLAVLWRRQRSDAAAAKAQFSKAPLWAYFGGIIGAATVMLTSTTVNTPLALAGTVALGLAGQVVLSLAADFWGLMGLPKRRLGWRDAGAVLLIASGSLLIVFVGVNPA